MSDLIQSGFDYAALPVDSALTARAAAERIKLRLKRTVEDIIEIGRELTAVKAYLPHGQFLPWIAAEFDMDQKTAFNFMSVNDRFGNKLGIIPNLKPTILYALSAPSKPFQRKNAKRFGRKPHERRIITAGVWPTRSVLCAYG